jgi:hypothetical protein
MSPTPLYETSFKNRFCDYFDCPLTDFEGRVFGEIVYPHAAWLVPLIRRWQPKFFAEDLRFISFLGTATGLVDVTAELRAFRETCRNHDGLLRRLLKVRVSGQRAARLAKELFDAAR